MSVNWKNRISMVVVAAMIAGLLRGRAKITYQNDLVRIS